MQLAQSVISPAEDFDIFYFLRNHTDGTTYYVRGVVYDVRTGAILLTTNLAQSATNSRLFSSTVQAPADSAGYGRNVVAIATVYTDSGYTTKSQDYEEQEQYFLVKAIAPNFGGGGGVDYRVMREIVDEVVKKRLSQLPTPERLPDMPFAELSADLAELQREVGKIPTDKFDAAPLIRRLGAIQAAIAAIPQPEPVDLQPIMDAIGALPEFLVSTMEEATAAWKETGNTLAREQQRAIDEMAGKIVKKAEAGLKDLISRQELTIPLSKLMKGEPELLPDISHLYA